jgi:hypothetical protein
MATGDSQADSKPIINPDPDSTGHARPWPTVRLCLLIIAVLLPGLYLVQLIREYGVDVPYADEFTFAPVLVKAHEHSLAISDLFAQHNEHRYFFTKLLLIAIAFTAQGNLRAEMFLSVLLTTLSSLNLWFLLRKTVPLSVEQRLFILFLFNLLLFSPVQAENWTWGFQFPLFFCNYLVTCGILVAFSAITLSRKFVICAALAFVGSFSFGGGVLLWAVTFPAALLAEKALTWKRKGVWMGAWAAAAIVCMTLYFFHYVKPPHHPAIAQGASPIRAYRYVAGFLGSHLSRATSFEPITQAVSIGTVLLALYLGSMFYAKRRSRDPSLAIRMLPWFALGGYAVLSGVLAAAARIGFGISQALDSRYTSFSLYLSIAVIALFIIAKDDLQRRATLSRAFVRLETVLLMGLAFFSVTSYTWGRTFMVESERARLRGKGALLFTNVIDSGELHDQCLIANAPEARAFANQLDGIGLLHPRMLTTAEISKLQTRPQLAGFLDGITIAGKESSARGWAINPKTKRPTYSVVLTYNDPDKGEVAFRMANEACGRPDVAEAVQSPVALWSGWNARFDRAAIPPGEHLISAWAFDAKTGILYPLGTPKLID